MSLKKYTVVLSSHDSSPTVDIEADSFTVGDVTNNDSSCVKFFISHELIAFFSYPASVVRHQGGNDA